MSLISQAILIVVKHMLLGRTWAEGQILMQPIDPIVGMLRPGPENGKPVIAVYADRAAGKPTGLETQGGPQSVDLKVYVYVPPSRFELPDGVAFEIDNTGAGLALNLIGRQVDAAFHFGDPDWLAVFRRFVTRVEGKVVGYVLVEVENSVRIPCMEIAYDLITVAEADFGKPIYGAWAELDVLLRKTDEGRHLADMIKSMIETPSGLLPYQQFQVNFGTTDAAIRAVGLGPITDDGSTPLLTDVELVPPVPPRMP